LSFCHLIGLEEIAVLEIIGVGDNESKDGNSNNTKATYTYTNIPKWSLANKNSSILADVYFL
jgi:hypothetical protein